MNSRRFVPLLLVALLAVPARAQNTLDHPLGSPQPYFVDSGVMENPGATTATVHQEVVHVPQAGWLRLYFGDVELQGASFLRVTSLLDDEIQELDVNPLMVLHEGQGAVAVDARVILTPK